MIEWWDYYLWGYEAPTGGMGMATTLHTEPERDRGAERGPWGVLIEVEAMPC